MKRNFYRLQIPSNPRHLPEADRFLEEKLRQHGLDDDTIADLAISTTELINNAIVHGNKLDQAKLVTIELEFAGKRLTISICDQGAGFNMQALPSPISDENLMKEAGRGIFIVRRLVDELVIQNQPGGGTRMIIIKNLA